MSLDQSAGPAALPKTLYGYNVVSCVGHGAGSSIYAVTDAAGQLFALKHVVKREEKDERYVEQLRNEFDVSRLFRHPALRKIIEVKVPRKLFGKANEAALVMEWVDGTPLDERRPQGVAEVLDIFSQAGAALLSLHKLTYVHCDFKPQNILCGTSDQRVKLIDFGQTCKSETAKQRVQGTPDFITPEQVKCLAVDARTDVYALGASMYWALTGQRVPTYFTVDRHERDVVKHQRYPAPHELNPAVPERLSKLVMICMRYHPDDRPKDMRVVLEYLDESSRSLAAASAIPAVKPAPVAAEPVKPVVRHPLED